jgi:hypothetical protein
MQIYQRKRSSHLTRVIIENFYTYSPYKGAKLNYARDYEPVPQVNVDLVLKMDIERAIKNLYKRKELSDDELKMLRYVAADGRLSRRDISAMIKAEEGIYVDQRTISRKLSSAYNKISKELGFEYSDSRMYQIIAKKMGRPEPYILSDEEIDKVQQLFEKV